MLRAILWHILVIRITSHHVQRPGAKPADAQFHTADARVAGAQGLRCRRFTRRRIPAAARRRQCRHAGESSRKKSACTAVWPSPSMPHRRRKRIVRRCAGASTALPITAHWWPGSRRQEHRSRHGPRRGLTALRRLEQAVEKLARIDFFPGQAKEQAAAAFASLKNRYAELYARNEPRPSGKGLRPLERALPEARLGDPKSALGRSPR